MAPSSTRTTRSAWLVISLEILKYVSPLGWDHINLTGIYSWGEQPTLVDGFRPICPAKDPRMNMATQRLQFIHTDSTMPAV
jgi:hypothetical protein